MRGAVASAVAFGVVVAWLAWRAAGVGAQAVPGVVGGVPAGLTVAIDAGHGGDDPGAMGPGGTEEKSLTLSVAQRLRAALQARRGFRVVLTREDDRRLTADQRAALANGAGAGVFVSLHANASPSPATSGFEVGSWLGTADRAPRDSGTEEPAPLLSVASGLPRRVVVLPWHRAQAPYQESSSKFAQDLARRLAETGRLGPRGVFRAPLRSLAAVAAPAVLVELGYLSNDDDEPALGADARQGAVADAIVRALEAMMPAPSP
ncbi:MAG TPA: N-acetylmuramoyl-L-alanine amidase [Vicinamibacterales bacterium]